MKTESEDNYGTNLTEEQIQELWDKFYPRLRISIAERVRRMQRPVASHSEIALSAFHSLIRRAKQGEFPDLSDESGFWSLLRTIAVRKANDAQKNLWAQKRGGSQPTLGQSDSQTDDGKDAIGQAADDGRSELTQVELAEVFNSILDKMPNDRYRDVILLKLQGADTQTIADCLGTTQRTVQRLLKNIKQDWEQGLQS